MLYLLAIFLPPVAVLLAGKPIQALINFVLTLFLWFPGMIHALLVVSSHHADKRTGKLMSQAERQHQESLRMMQQQAEIEAARLGLAPPQVARPVLPPQPAPSTGPSTYQTVLYCIGGLLVLVIMLVAAF
jgi:uncharacterized membrane protein YqaE (UPF0057 family)